MRTHVRWIGITVNGFIIRNAQRCAYVRISGKSYAMHARACVLRVCIHYYNFGEEKKTLNVTMACVRLV